MLRTISLRSILLVLIALLSTSIFLFSKSFAASSSYPLTSSPVDIEPISSAVDIEAVVDHTRFFSSLKSRVTGYPGNLEAAEYINDTFTKYSLTNVQFHTFNVTVPISYGASLRVVEPPGFPPISIYPLWPNKVAPVKTPPSGLMGNLIYVGTGRLSDFNGKKVEDSIVLMDFNTECNWLTAAKLGAQAVIFIAPENTNREEARLKLVDVPFSFYRFYIEREDAQHLLNLLESQGVIVQVFSDVRFQSVTAKNIMGYVEGTDYKDNYILLTAHYDSFSYIPSLAPGAAESCGISSLLELAKFFVRHPAKYTLIFIAFSGTDQGDLGSRWFVKDWIEGKWNEFGKNVVLQIHLDLNPESTTLAPMLIGGFYSGWQEQVATWITKLRPYVISLETEIESQLGKSWIINYDGFYASPGSPAVTSAYIMGDEYIPLDNEPLVNIGGPGTAWITSDTVRQYHFTPLDTIDKYEFSKLKYQLEYVYPVIYCMVNTEDLRPNYLPEWSLSYAHELGPKWSDVLGTVAEYDTSTGWYKAVPNAIVCYYQDSDFPSRDNFNIYTMTDQNGRFFIPGLQQYYRVPNYHISAYVVNDTNGEISYAPDFGEYRYQGPLEIGALQIRFHPFDIGILTVFKCAHIVLFDIFDHRWVNSIRGGSVIITLNDFTSHSALIYRHSTSYTYGGLGVGIAVSHVPVNTPVEILIQADYDIRYPLAYLANLTETSTVGTGYTMTRIGEQMILTNTPLHYAENLYWLVNSRIQAAAAQRLATAHIKNHILAGELLDAAKYSLSKYQYDKAYADYTEAWRLERDVYFGFRRETEDSINTVPFFGITLIPFAYLFELLVLRQRGIKRIISLLSSFTVPLIVLWLLHPGFVLASNIAMVLAAFAILVLLSPILLIIYNNLSELVRSMYTKVIGQRFTDIGRTKVFTLGISYGIEFMRKTTFRTTSILITVILVTAALVSFTSMSSVTILSVKPIGTASYDGLLIHHDEYSTTPYMGYGAGPAIGQNMLDIVNTRYGPNVTIIPRAWRYAHTWRPPQLYQSLLISEDGLMHMFTVFLGLTPYEENATKVNAALINGRWFVPSDHYACIIDDEAATRLGISELPARVAWMGMNLTVIGVIKGSILMEIVDLDGEKITPLDYSIPTPWHAHLDSSDVVIIPYQLCLEIGGWIASCVFVPKNSSLILDLAKSLYDRFGVTIYAGSNGQRYMLSKGSLMTVMGIQFQIVPLMLCIFSILNIMLSSVYERMSIIKAYSSVGLSPFHVAIMFLSESFTIALLGAIMGYLLAMGLCFLSSSYFPGILSLNYSSSYVIISIISMIAVTVLSTILPMIEASKIVTPSLERKWKLPPPHGDMWNVSFPFFADTDEEANGIMAYIEEYVVAHRRERAEIFHLRGFSHEAEKVGAEQFIKKLVMNISLSPYELGVTQTVSFMDVKELRKERHYFNILIERKEGPTSDWQRLNRVFIDEIRKQLLTWKSLSSKIRSTYYQRA